MIVAEARRHERTLAARLGRCMSVSVVTTLLSLVSLVVLTTVVGLAAMPANVVTTALATIPSYHLNRRWTWAKHGASDPWREMLPFWLLSFAGLALSTVTVGIAAHWAASGHLVQPWRTAAVLIGHLGGFGILWIAQFLILDRVLFAPSVTAATGQPGPTCAVDPAAGSAA